MVLAQFEWISSAKKEPLLRRIFFKFDMIQKKIFKDYEKKEDEEKSLKMRKMTRGK